MIDLPEPLRALSGKVEAVIYVATSGAPRQPLFVSAASGPLFGFTPEQLTAEPELWLAHVHPVDAARVRAELRAATGAPWTPLKFRLVHADGRVIWCRETMVSVEGDNVVSGVVADVTELELPQKALEASLAASDSTSAVLGLCDALAQGFALSYAVFVDAKTGARLVQRHGALGVTLASRWDEPVEFEPWAAQGNQSP